MTELCRGHGTGESTFYQWKQQFGSLKVDEVKRLRLLEEEHRKLKKLVAGQPLDSNVF